MSWFHYTTIESLRNVCSGQQTPTPLMIWRVIIPPSQKKSLMTKMEQHGQSVSNKHLSQQNKCPKLDLSPVVYITVNQTQQSLSIRALTVFLDSGSSHIIMKRDNLPHGTIATATPSSKTTTTNGVFATNLQATLTLIKFPEFGNHCINQISTNEVFCFKVTRERPCVTFGLSVE